MRLTFNIFDRARLISLSLGGLSALLVMCFGAIVADWAGSWTSSAYGFIIFNAVFSLAVVGLMATAPFCHQRFGKPLFRYLVEPLTEAVLTGILTVFWFSGFVAVTVVRPVECPLSVCGVARGTIAFSFFALAAFGLLFAIRLRDCLYKHQLKRELANKENMVSVSSTPQLLKGNVPLPSPPPSSSTLVHPAASPGLPVSGNRV
ncbi:hypothetical protein IWQ61_005235 [Dispira simplex]|nr:hypothetical protein IWQ61_005235 [Dispira simplex]